MTTTIIIVAVLAVIVTAVVFGLIRGGKKGEKPSVVQEPSKPVEKPAEAKETTNDHLAPAPSKDNLDEIKQSEPKDDKASIPDFVKNIVAKFGIDVPEDGKTMVYLMELYKEANVQFRTGKSYNGLPTIIKEDNFPNIYNFYGDKGSDNAAWFTLVGWLFAMQLAELRPQDRTAIYKVGYEMGGYNKDSNLYGYQFRFDPNVLRLSAAAIWAAMRGVCKPDVDAMREECGYHYHGAATNIEMIIDFEDSFKVDKDDFYVDLRKFMPTAPGPYAPNYKDRSQIGGYPYPNDAKTDDYNLAIDRAIRDMVVEKYNLENKIIITNENYNDEEALRELAYQNSLYTQATVQAIADKDANYNHLFGKSREVEGYTFWPVFTEATLGQAVYPSLAKPLCELVNDVLYIGSYQRCILQGHEGQENPPQYGRLRPGCSWNVEAHRHSDTDDTQNVLVDFFIEDGDGNPTGYYNEDGEWSYKDDIHSPEEYNDKMKDELWANSYPSGHSAGSMSVCMLLIELLPMQADKILAASNRFAVNRTIARYHWNSDTIQGRVLATCIAPIIRCCSDWNERFEEAKKCLK